MRCGIEKGNNPSREARVLGENPDVWLEDPRLPLTARTGTTSSPTPFLELDDDSSSLGKAAWAGEGGVPRRSKAGSWLGKGLWDGEEAWGFGGEALGEVWEMSRACSYPRFLPFCLPFLLPLSLTSGQPKRLTLGNSRNSPHDTTASCWEGLEWCWWQRGEVSSWQ